MRGGFLGDTIAGVEDLERAIAFARASGNHRAELDAIAWLIPTYLNGPMPLDTAISRAEQFLDQASADPWAKAELLQVLAWLYAQAGRIADARTAISRAQAAHTRTGAKINAAVAAEIAGYIEMIAGDAAVAEQQLKQACEALRAAELAWDLPTVLPSLAEAVYAQGRLDEAEQLTEEAQALAGPGGRPGPRITIGSLLSRAACGPGRSRSAWSLRCRATSGSGAGGWPITLPAGSCAGG